MVRIGPITILTALLVTGVSGEGRPRHRALAPRTILRKIARAYAACSSYQDEGAIVTTYEETTGGRIDKEPFELHFKRPDLFRVDWIDYNLHKEGQLSVVWSNKQGTFTYWEPNTYEKNPNMKLGIAGATGVSHGAAYTIPSLLIPKMGGWKLTDLARTTLLGEETFEGVKCYHLKGLDQDGDPTEIWIGARDYFVRMVRSYATFKRIGVSTIEDEIHRNIRINQQIAEASFDYKPPIGLGEPKSLPPGGVLYAPEAPSWTEFSSEEGGFKLLMPATPIPQTTTFESMGRRIVHHTFIASKGGVTCIIDYADLPKGSGNAGNAEALFDRARDEFLKQAQGKLTSQKAILFAGYAGREIRLSLFDGQGQARFYLVNDRLYQVAITELNDTVNRADEINKFFDSLKIVVPPGTMAFRLPTSWFGRNSFQR